MAWFLPGVLGNLFGGPATRMYPFQKREPFERARGQIVFDGEKCNLCGACARRCPAAVITVDRVARTYRFENFRCIICEACAEACPRKALTVDNHHRAPAYQKDVLLYTAPPEEKPAPKAAATEA